jgi:DNA-binding NarL/FixJ family response regulator
LIERFIADPPPDASAAAQLGGLTAREREVLVEVARGCSNREVAQVLFIGEGTVKTHLAHLLTKLGLRDRVQAVVFAYESGLIRRGEARRDAHALGGFPPDRNEAIR